MRLKRPRAAGRHRESNNPVGHSTANPLLALLEASMPDVQYGCSSRVESLESSRVGGLEQADNVLVRDRPIDYLRPFELVEHRCGNLINFVARHAGVLNTTLSDSVIRTS